MPKAVETFDLIDGVWIKKPRYALPLAIALRLSMIESAERNFAAEGQRTKTELVYQDLTGPRFRQRIDAIVEKFTNMQSIWTASAERRCVSGRNARTTERRPKCDRRALWRFARTAGHAVSDIESLNNLLA